MTRKPLKKIQKGSDNYIILHSQTGMDLKHLFCSQFYELYKLTPNRHFRNIGIQ